jgi:hypothetical protein
MHGTLIARFAIKEVSFVKPRMTVTIVLPRVWLHETNAAYFSQLSLSLLPQSAKASFSSFLLSSLEAIDNKKTLSNCPNRIVDPDNQSYWFGQLLDNCAQLDKVLLSNLFLLFLFFV